MKIHYFRADGQERMHTGLFTPNMVKTIVKEALREMEVPYKSRITANGFWLFDTKLGNQWTSLHDIQTYTLNECLQHY